MSYKIIGRTLGLIMLVEATAMVLMALVSLLYRESPLPFLYTILILAVLGLPLTLLCKSNTQFHTRDAYVSTVLSWVCLSVFGALPFYFSGRFGSFINCVFEAVSGFTTTGATILPEVESLPHGILLWRSFSHFLGGMGILVLTTAIVRVGESREHHLMSAEVPGPTSDKLVPKLSQSSKILYSIYAGMTLLQVLILIGCGMKVFDSFNIAFATAGTGGFAVTNTSISAYNSPAIEIVVGVFMLLFGINFSIHFLILTRRWKEALRDNELRFFLIFVAAAVGLITLNLVIRNLYDSVGTSLRHAFFTVSSIVSTTGFSTENFDIWPRASHIIIIILMFTGACAGSTCGGLKMSRVLMLLKSVHREVLQIIHPNSYNVVRFNGKAVESRTLNSVYRFFAAYIAVLAGAAFLVALDDFDIITTFTGVLSCLSNIGPGLQMVSPIGNFSIFSDFSKIVLSLCMLIGRLEIFPILLFFSPGTWKRT